LLLVLIGLWDGYEQETKALGFSGIYERYLASQAGFADDAKAYRPVVEAESARTAVVAETHEQGIFLYCAVVLVLAICGIAAATAQFPPPPSLPTPPAEAQPVPTHRKARRLLGLQTHQSSEIGAVDSPRSAAKRPINSGLVIGLRGAETTYPDLDCTGTLTRVGESKSYVFFVEIITKSAVDKGGRFPRRYYNGCASG
jgi:hypothetical protein